MSDVTLNRNSGVSSSPGATSHVQQINADTSRDRAPPPLSSPSPPPPSPPPLCCSEKQDVGRKWRRCSSVGCSPPRASLLLGPKWSLPGGSEPAGPAPVRPGPRPPGQNHGAGQRVRRNLVVCIHGPRPHGGNKL